MLKIPNDRRLKLYINIDFSIIFAKIEFIEVITLCIAVHNLLSTYALLEDQ